MYDLRPIETKDIASCILLLRSLPQWFAIEEAIIEYGKNLKALDGLVAIHDAKLVGFIGLKRYEDRSVEIDVMAVDSAHHGKGLGSILLERVESALGDKPVLLHVKTLGPSRPDPNYAATRSFWTAKGFISMDVHNLWGESDPCLVMVKPLNFVT